MVPNPYPGAHNVIPDMGRVPKAVQFGMFARKDYSPSLMRSLKSHMENCHYGMDMDAYLADPKFKAVLLGNGNIRVSHFVHAPAKNDAEPLKGACHDLAYQLGERLYRTLGKQYGVMLVEGVAPAYFSQPDNSHYFLMLWPLRKSRWMKPQVVDVIDHPDRKLPDYCLLLDPSFRKMGTEQSMTGYRIKQVAYQFGLPPNDWQRRHLGRTLELSFVEDRKGHASTHCFPVGFYRDLFRHPAPGTEHAMLHLFFQKNTVTGIVTPALAIHMTPDARPLMLSAPEKTICANAQLKQLMAKLARNLAALPPLP